VIPSIFCVTGKAKTFLTPQLLLNGRNATNGCATLINGMGRIGGKALGVEELLF